MSKIRAAFAERTMRSWKAMLHRSLEDYGYKYHHKLQHFVAPFDSGKKCLVDLSRKYFNFWDFLAILYNKPLQIRVNQNSKQEIEYASLYMICQSKSFTSHNLFKRI